LHGTVIITDNEPDTVIHLLKIDRENPGILLRVPAVDNDSGDLLSGIAKDGLNLSLRSKIDKFGNIYT